MTILTNVKFLVEGFLKFCGLLWTLTLIKISKSTLAVYFRANYWIVFVSTLPFYFCRKPWKNHTWINYFSDIWYVWLVWQICVLFLKSGGFHCCGLARHNVGWKDLVGEYILYFQMGPQEDILASRLAFVVFKVND